MGTPYLTPSGGFLYVGNRRETPSKGNTMSDTERYTEFYKTEFATL